MVGAVIDRNGASMAKKSRQSFMKRQRERDRAEKAALKRQRRAERKADRPEGEEEGVALDPDHDPDIIDVREIVGDLGDPYEEEAAPDEEQIAEARSGRTPV